MCTCVRRVRITDDIVQLSTNFGKYINNRHAFFLFGSIGRPDSSRHTPDLLVQMLVLQRLVPRLRDSASFFNYTLPPHTRSQDVSFSDRVLSARKSGFWFRQACPPHLNPYASDRVWRVCFWKRLVESLFWLILTLVTLLSLFVLLYIELR